MNSFKILVTPEYFFRHRRAWLRFQRGLRGPPPDSAQVALPWGDRIRVHPRETIGAHLWNYGIFDLAVAKTLTRLIDPGDTAIDVGANIGQMTSLMRWRAGPAGKVFAFEPHPELFRSLEELVEAGDGSSTLAPVRLFRTALSGDAFKRDWLRRRACQRLPSVSRVHPHVRPCSKLAIRTPCAPSAVCFGRNA